jgi:hypothetical protein
MKNALLFLIAFALVSPETAWAADGASQRSRGWLTGVGLGFVAVGLTGVGLGVGGATSAADANRYIEAYLRVAGGNVPLATDASAVATLQKRAAAAQSLATAGFLLGGVGLAGALTCFLLDGLWLHRPVDVTFVPAAGAGGVLVTARF